MKMTNAMTAKAWAYVGLIADPEKNFSDDGTRFRMFKTNKGGKYEVYVSYTTSSGTKFLALREDYSDYGGTNYDFFEKYSKVDTWRWNGTDSPIDLDELKASIDQLYADLNNAEEAFSKEFAPMRGQKKLEAVEALQTKIDAFTRTAIVVDNFNWMRDFDTTKVGWKAKDEVEKRTGKDYTYRCDSLYEVQDSYKNIISEKAKANKMLEAINNDTISDNELYENDWIKDRDNAYENFYIRKIRNTLELLAA